MSDIMLSQDEVDALFKQATGKSIVHAPSSAPSEKSVAKPSGAPTASPSAAQTVPPTVPPLVVPLAPVAKPAAPPSPSVASTTPPLAKPAMFTAQEIRPRPVTPQPVVAPPIASTPHNGALVDQLQTTVVELTRRLARAEKRLSQIEQSKETPPASQNTASARELARLNAQMESMRLKLEATPGYNSRNLLTCSSCGTNGQISVAIKCNHCGQEGWWGWFPRESLDE